MSTVYLRYVCGVVVALVIAVLARDAAGEIPSDLRGAVDAAVARGVAFLLLQQRDDGHFDSNGLYAGHAAVTALCGLALLADDNTLTRGEHAERLSRCMHGLIALAQPSGLIGESESPLQPMYAHGYAVTFLAEICGQEPPGDTKQLRDTVRRSINLIVRTQNTQGGWRYLPRIVDDADISVTATQLIALRSAKNAGFLVPSETVAAATRYITQLQNDDGDNDNGSGGFGYRFSERESGFSRTAAAVVALQASGDYRSNSVTRGFAYLASQHRQTNKQQPIAYEIYGLFYTANALYCDGDHNTPTTHLAWEPWYIAIVRDMISRQNADGSWSSTVSREADTAMIITLLRLPNNRVALGRSIQSHRLERTQ